MKKGLTKGIISTICISGMLMVSSPAYAALPVLKTGSRGTEVTKVQTQLKEWGYYTYSNITGYYGNITKDSVIYFQQKNGLVADGIVGEKTYQALGISESKTATSRGSNTSTLAISQVLKKGSKGDEVKQLQAALQALGYYNMAIDGDFGNGTHKAVTAFQTDHGLYVDGVVGQATCNAINNGGIKQMIEMIDWSSVDGMFPRKTTAKVTDVVTGKTFTVIRYGGSLHADVEPATANDTVIMKEIYTDWSWTRRAIIVELGGKRIAASMNGMPHGGQIVYGNNFDGHFCIHFLNSRTHGGNNLDANHQAMVQAAYES